MNKAQATHIAAAAGCIAAAVRVRAVIARHGLLTVVWDLDDCLIKSEHLRDETDEGLRCTVQEKQVCFTYT